MGDIAKGIKSFRKGLSEDDDEKREPPKVIDYTSRKSPTREAGRHDEVTARGAIRHALGQLTLEPAAASRIGAAHD